VRLDILEKTRIRNETPDTPAHIVTIVDNRFLFHHILYPPHFNQVVVGLLISFCP